MTRKSSSSTAITSATVAIVLVFIAFLRGWVRRPECPDGCSGVLPPAGLRDHSTG
jgi:hypothetical protein